MKKSRIASYFLDIIIYSKKLKPIGTMAGNRVGAEKVQDDLIQLSVSKIK